MHSEAKITDAFPACDRLVYFVSVSGGVVEIRKEEQDILSGVWGVETCHINTEDWAMLNKMIPKMIAKAEADDIVLDGIDSQQNT